MHEADVPYDFEIPRIVEEIRRISARRILIQMPDGLKRFSRLLSEKLREQIPGLDIVFSASPSWGACVLDDLEAAEGGFDLLVHIGHVEYPYYRPRHRTLFIPAYSLLEIPEDLVEQASEILSSRGVRRVAVFSTIQHARQVERASKVLSKRFDVVLHSSGTSLVGCDYSRPYSIRGSVDGYLMISGGLFHALGIGLTVPGKVVVKLDPYEGRAVDLTPEVERVLRRRLYVITRAMDARTWCLVDGLKGQGRPWYRRYLRGLIERRGGEAIEYIASEITRETLLNIDTSEIDAYTILACPRIPTDDLWDFHKPVLTPAEARMALTGKLDGYTFPW